MNAFEIQGLENEKKLHEIIENFLDTKLFKTINKYDTFDYINIDKNLYVEQLIKEIPYEVSSRLSIFALIDVAVKKGFLEKRNSNGDRRKKEIIPSQTFVDEYKEWLTSFSSQLDHKKKNGKETKTLNTD